MVLSAASYIPEKIVTNDDLSKTVDTSDEWITSRTGIRQRHLAGDKDTVLSMSIAVAKGLMEKSGLSPSDIGIIIVCTVTGEYAMPAAACVVQNEIGAENAFAFDISAACSGFVYGLSVASKFLIGGECKNAMVIGSEILSRAVDWDDRSTCVLFGDGAGGIIFNKPLLSYDLHSDGSKAMCLTVERERKGSLKMDGRAVMDMATRKAPVSINTALNKAGMTVGDIKYIVPHQANSRIIDAVARKLGTDKEKFYMNIERYGNTSAASIPICLEEMSRKGLIKKDDNLLLVGFGAGFTWASAIITI